ncbi:hypothetical protein N825_27140 [Skermanella stibiiresistens SB22]|uniref:Uncharacterized protein n=1 Tax=Skermanella stibiiresistens SB22 TaxID=1385369 RepID=W9GY64_9PROT|nr:hypothetical protein [Skermanella stibiiresistens]EWY36423.1 hypothetical protein N825_27140 [Skermanella stibiiresistens SB22]
MDRVLELEAQVAALQRRLDEAEIRARQAERARELEAITRHVREAALAEGVLPTALDDVSDRAIRSGQWKLSAKGDIYRVEDGVPVVTPAGDYVTPRAWLKGLKEQAGFYFADDPHQQANAGVVNPWTKDHWNLSEQGRIARESHETAQRLAAEAGSTLGATRPSEGRP